MCILKEQVFVSDAFGILFICFGCVASMLCAKRENKPPTDDQLFEYFTSPYSLAYFVFTIFVVILGLQMYKNIKYEVQEIWDDMNSQLNMLDNRIIDPSNSNRTTGNQTPRSQRLNTSILSEDNSSDTKLQIQVFGSLDKSQLEYVPQMTKEI